MPQTDISLGDIDREASNHFFGIGKPGLLQRLQDLHSKFKKLMKLNTELMEKCRTKDEKIKEQNNRANQYESDIKIEMEALKSKIEYIENNNKQLNALCILQEENMKKVGEYSAEEIEKRNKVIDELNKKLAESLERIETLQDALKYPIIVTENYEDNIKEDLLIESFVEILKPQNPLGLSTQLSSSSLRSDEGRNLLKVNVNQPLPTLGSRDNKGAAHYI